MPLELGLKVLVSVVLSHPKLYKGGRVEYESISKDAESYVFRC